MPTNSIHSTKLFERNILKVYRRATDTDMGAGISWYANARKICDALATENNVLPPVAIGVLAAFSPMMSWKMNIELASQCLRTKHFTGHYGANNRKAKKIYQGSEPLDVLGGNKVRAFYNCILSSGDCQDVVIDRHAIAVALGRIASEKERCLTGKQYRTFAQAYRNVAKKIGLRPSDLQAIVWVTWRREKGITE